MRGYFYSAILIYPMLYFDLLSCPPNFYTNNNDNSVSKEEFNKIMGNVGNDVGVLTDQVGEKIYKGGSEGRSFGLGGTTYLWGGSLLPFSKIDFEKQVVLH